MGVLLRFFNLPQPTMKVLLFVALAIAAVVAEPEADPKADADAAAHYYGGYYGRGYGYGYGLGYRGYYGYGGYPYGYRHGYYYGKQISDLKTQKFTAIFPFSSKNDCPSPLHTSSKKRKIFGSTEEISFFKKHLVCTVPTMVSNYPYVI